VGSFGDASSGLPPDSSLILLERAKGGDRLALDALFLRYRARLRAWSRGRLPRWARGVVDTEDVVQDAFLHTLRQLDHIEPRTDAGLQAYLRQAVRNRIKDELRRTHARPPIDSVPALDPADHRSPLEEAIGAETVERYERALAALRETEREAIVARIELGLDYEELAVMLGRPSPDAARMVVSRALLRLAQEMRGEHR
jgi:RNA polymerase sigma-70 factor (ECF subfamily)